MSMHGRYEPLRTPPAHGRWTRSWYARPRCTFKQRPCICNMCPCINSHLFVMRLDAGQHGTDAAVAAHEGRRNGSAAAVGIRDVQHQRSGRPEQKAHRRLHQSVSYMLGAKRADDCIVVAKRAGIILPCSKKVGMLECFSTLTTFPMYSSC